MDQHQQREPIFNVPSVVLLLLLLLAGIHGVREWLLSATADSELLLTFAFVPSRYGADALVLPGGFGAQLWTFVTYAFLHADLTHLGFNAVWLLAFASPLARRFGGLRFFAFVLVASAAGALAHLVTHFGERMPMIGASAAVSGAMAASVRFAFQPGGSLDFWSGDGSDPDRIPAAPLMVALRNPRVLTFVGLWFGLNFLFGVGVVSITGEEQSVAWQAHVGGFLAGLLLFSVFDPVPPGHGHTLH